MVSFSRAQTRRKICSCILKLLKAFHLATGTTVSIFSVLSVLDNKVENRIR